MAMRDFRLFKGPIQQQFQRLSTTYDLFRVKIDKDELWELYLRSFPAGTNSVFRQRREYDCSCCKQFIRSIGDVVAIVDNTIVSLWRIRCDDPVYQLVADEMAAVVERMPIDNVFRSIDHVAGTDKTFEEAVYEERLSIPPITWNHFFVNIPRELVVKKADLGPKQAESRAQHDVLLRSLTEIRDDAIETVLDLISQGSLYRGDEQRKAVEDFRKVKATFAVLEFQWRDNFVWQMIDNVAPNVAKIRNTAIGTLLIDLSEGMELDAAVRRFEAIMAPANYKRPTALVTAKMIAAAKETLTELGLISALERRYACLTDVRINNLLFVDRSARRVLVNDVFDELPTRANPASRQTTKVDEIGIEDFVQHVLPRISTMEVLMENRVAGNLVSLVTAADATARRLFKWDNQFSWSYRGDFADSIKERVKAAGGNVTGDLLCRLSWSNYDDLDLHMKEPTGYEIYFGNKGIPSSSGGVLDVDMNVLPNTRTPVENIFYSSRSHMREGTYSLYVHCYTSRESKDVGFEVEFDYLGNTTSFAYDKMVKRDEIIRVVTFMYLRAHGVEIIDSLPPSEKSTSMWGLRTQQFHRVEAMMLSPNCWDEAFVGNKHYFFMLEGCKNDMTARGFYNEFLKGELTPHRKVIEMVGAKMRTEETGNQLSGLGFSSTQKNNVLIRVTGAYTRTLKVMF